MVNEPEPDTGNEETTVKAARGMPLVPYVILVAVVMLLGIGVYFGIVIRDQEPDFYAPGRSELVNARIHFEKLQGYEQALIEQQRLVHEEISKAITLLTKAESLDPEHITRIEALRQQLLSLEQASKAKESGPVRYTSNYSHLMEQIGALITELENHSKQP